MPRPDALADEPFSWRTSKDGTLFIQHHGRPATTHRGREAAKLVARLERATPEEAQQVMARATGQFRFGNERSGGPRD